MTDKTLRKKIKSHWDIDKLADELCDTTWYRTEPRRYDRMIYLGSYEHMKEYTRDAFGEKEWNEAKEKYYENELVDDYMNILSEIVSKEGICEAVKWPKGVKEWRPSEEPTDKPIGHVYGTFEDGDAFLGQYEEGVTEEDMKAMGYKVEES